MAHDLTPLPPFPAPPSRPVLFLYRARLQLAITRSTTCKACNGSGGADGAKETECKDCRGQGVRVVLRQLGPGMVQQMQMPCGACKGQGSVIPDGKRCRPCDGKKTVQEKKALEVHVTKGITNGTKIVMHGEAGDAPGASAGDVIFHIKVEEHKLFQRVHQHLLIEKDLPLVDALTGFSFPVKHLDGRVLTVKSPPGAVIQPGSYMQIAGAGMPLSSNHFRFGDLIVRFNVIFPPTGSLSASGDALKKLLPRTMDSAAKQEVVAKRKAAFKARTSGRDEDEGGADDDDDGRPFPDWDDAPAGAAASKGAKGAGSSAKSSGGASSSGAGGDEEMAHDEDVTLVPCSIKSKIAEAQEMANEDKRCVRRRGATDCVRSRIRLS